MQFGWVICYKLIQVKSQDKKMALLYGLIKVIRLVFRYVFCNKMIKCKRKQIHTLFICTRFLKNRVWNFFQKSSWRTDTSLPIFFWLPISVFLCFRKSFTGNFFVWTQTCKLYHCGRNCLSLVSIPSFFVMFFYFTEFCLDHIPYFHK